MVRLFSKKIFKSIESLKEINKNIEDCIKALEDTQMYIYYGLRFEEKLSEIRKQLEETISWLQDIRKELENLGK